MTAGPSRVAGRGVLLRTLRALIARTEKFAHYRARTRDDERWAAILADALERAFTTARSAPGAQAALDAIDARRAVAMKRTIR